MLIFETSFSLLTNKVGNIAKATAIAVASLHLFAPAQASTLNITGGKTKITFGADAVAALESFNITLTAAVTTAPGGGHDEPVAAYGISGGSLHGNDIEIEYVPPILLLSNDVGATAILENFFINLDGLTLTGTVFALVGGCSVFVEVLGIAAPATDGGGVQPFANQYLATALTSGFSVPDSAGVSLAIGKPRPMYNSFRCLPACHHSQRGS